MHTNIVLDDGVLRTSLTVDEDTEIDRSRWRASITPAVCLLRSLGGGGLCVVHLPGELAPQ